MQQIEQGRSNRRALAAGNGIHRDVAFQPRRFDPRTADRSRFARLVASARLQLRSWQWLSVHSNMELDHVFVFVEPDGPELAYLRSLGLSETYRRRHPGQGTENICFGFDNIFLECLWINSVEEATGDLIARTGLYERSQWRTHGTSPFGFAWRDNGSRQPVQIATWPFMPPYLPAGMRIDVAVESDDPRQPMMFKYPGSMPPDQWSVEKRGVLQEPAGYGRVMSVAFHWPNHAPPTPSLLALAAATIIDVVPARDDATSISLFVEQRSSSTPLQISLPWSPV